MIKSEIKKIVSRELSSFLSIHGYKPEKVKGDLLVTFEKNDGSYFYDFYSYTNKYNDYELVYGFSFGIARIVSILREIDLVVPLSTSKYEIKPSITGISPGRLLDPYATGRGYTPFNNESGLMAVTEEIKYFYEHTFVPFCEKYSRFEELDKLMNSPDDFWVDSDSKTIPFSFFHVTRLIIARLANNPDFDMVVEKNFQALEELWRKFDGVYDRTDKTKPEVFAVDYLKGIQ
ncbi:MAG: hypothetical protein ABWZ25_17970 [Chitinophagaceae bacterium]